MIGLKGADNEPAYSRIKSIDRELVVIFGTTE
jgi:hypothetical protein